MTTATNILNKRVKYIQNDNIAPRNTIGRIIRYYPRLRFAYVEWPDNLITLMPLAYLQLVNN